MVVHLQNADPSNLETTFNIADGTWRYTVFVYQMRTAAVYLNGKKAAERTVSARIPTHPLGEWTNEGPLFFGSYPPDELSCDGELGPVRISHAARTIEGIPASINFPVDYHTVGCWNFEHCAGSQYSDASKTGNHIRLIDYLPTLDENDRRAFGVTTSPFHRPMLPVDFTSLPTQPAPHAAPAGLEQMLLHGDWQYKSAMPHGLSEASMLHDENAWQDAFTAQTPASVQTALFETGQIDDPMVEINNLSISWVADREWWLRKHFPCRQTGRTSASNCASRGLIIGPPSG